MEILSFVLGMFAVVVIVISIVAVVGFFKANKLERNFEDQLIITGNQFTNVENGSIRRDDEINRKIDETEREFYSQLDSRLDKLEKKLLGQNIMRGLSKESLERSKVIMDKIE